MRAIGIILAVLVLGGCSAAQRKLAEVSGDWTSAWHEDPDGFRIRVPSGWKVQKLGNGQVAVVSSDRKSYVVVAPVVGRLDSCGSLLQGAMSNGWGAFPNATGVSVRPRNRGTALAEFTMHAGQIRGAVLCSAAGPSAAMLFGLAAPAAEFASTRPQLLSLLRSFSYATPTSPSAPSAPAEPPLEQWRDPTESAFSVMKPAGWRAEGGITRVSNLDVRAAFRFTSPDGLSTLWIGDSRLATCMVPGPQTMQVPGTGGYGGWCPYATGTQLGESYVQRGLPSDYGLSAVQITNRRDRSDLSQDADRLPANAGLRGVRNAFGEVDFTATRNGAPVAGRVAANTTFMPSVDPNLVAGSLQRNINGYIAAHGKEAESARLMARVIASLQWNVQWVMANRGAARKDANATMNYLRGQAELGQRMFEERMESSGRRAEARGDLLSGTVRLQDSQGNRYQAKAGSNFYYAVEQGLAVESDPNRAVLGTDQWAPLHNGSIDLRPLEVIQ